MLISNYASATKIVGILSSWRESIIKEKVLADER